VCVCVCACGMHLGPRFANGAALWAGGLGTGGRRGSGRVHYPSRPRAEKHGSGCERRDETNSVKKKKKKPVTDGSSLGDHTRIHTHAPAPSPPSPPPPSSQKEMNLSKTIGFIGAGQMAEALARGFAARGIATPAQMWATDPVAARRDVFADFGATAVETNVEV